MGREVFDRIRQIPAFAPLDREGLERIAAQGRITRLAAGEYCFRVGEPALWVSVLIEGQVQITQPDHETEQVLVTYTPPDFFGEIPILLGEATYFANARALTDCKVFLLHVDTFWQILGEYPEATRQFMRAAAQRMNRLQSLQAQRDRLNAVSTLAAGLAHELGNPASAALRSTERLAESIWRVQATSAELARTLPPETYQELVGLVGSWLWEGDLPVLTPLTRADREDQVGGWLELRGIENAWEVNEPLVAAGLEVTDLVQLEARVPLPGFPSAIAWLAASAEAAGQVCTASRSSSRIAGLVETMKGYAYLDQGPLQDLDLNAALERTLAVLGYDLSGLEVVRDYDPELPQVTGYGPELGAVWTTLIENALQALDGRGRLELRTRREHEQVLVEVADSGPGIPAEIQRRILDPFFSTRGVGEGSGLGLSLAYYTVVERHRGSFEFTSRPGETRFRVRLPVHPATPIPRRAVEVGA
ncbi:MAG TPA: ATP-binding protein [Meiothermus sp.]|jgi:signal transduction histidine kinase|nr:ATP-binding protein [Meiothermus sp.]